MDTARRRMMAAAAACCASVAWGQKRRELRLVYFHNAPPYSYGEDTSVAGIFVDVLNEALGNRSGVALSHQGLPWARAQDMVRRGTADAFVTLVTPERQGYTNAGTVPVHPVEVHLYVAANHPRRAEIEAVRDLAGYQPYSLATYTGNSLATTVFGHMKVNLASTAEQSVEMAIVQRVDLVPAESVPMQRLLKNQGTPDALVRLDPVVARTDYFLQIRKSYPDPDALRDCDKALRAMMADGTLAAINARHQR